MNFYGDPIILEHQFHPLMLREGAVCLELTIALAIALRIAGIFSRVSGNSPSGTCGDCTACVSSDVV